MSSPGVLMSSSLISSLLSRSDLLGESAVLLFGGPCVIHNGGRLEVPDGSKRLLVFVALSTGRVDRRYAAGSLWPEGSDERAGGNLRSALWRLKCAGIDVLETDKCTLGMRRGTVVDVGVVGDWATRLVDGSATQTDLCQLNWRWDAMDLLPGWYDDWVIFERERIRQRLLHALEALSRRLVAANRCAEAVDAAISAVSADPLRESANRVLIEAHLAEGNLIEARRTFERYRDSVSRELGVEPGEQLASLVRAGFRLPVQGRRYRRGVVASIERLAASQAPGIGAPGKRLVPPVAATGP
jgi:DNA-binding SARP family transcriptional activator